MTPESPDGEALEPPTSPEVPEPELTRDERRSERQRLRAARKARRKGMAKRAYNGKNRAMGKQAKGKKR